MTLGSAPADARTRLALLSGPLLAAGESARVQKMAGSSGRNDNPS
jgi:hypothetical protein